MTRINRTAHHPVPLTGAELEAWAWRRLTAALADYAAAVSLLEYLTTTSGGGSAGPAGSARIDLAAATCTRARRACVDALRLLDTLTESESRPRGYGQRHGYLDEDEPAAS